VERRRIVGIQSGRVVRPPQERGGSPLKRRTGL
jgi:hypothetical protein